MFCSISGQVPEDPVVSAKSGHLFERRLIEKYVESEGTCPITKAELVKEDLISIQGNKAVKPRPVTATSVPGLLSLFQNEWDALMLETFQLKQHLDSVRQELSQALYQHDAACRVIARLTRERDEARAALRVAQANAAQGVAGAGAVDTDMEAKIADEIPAAVISSITALSKKLSKGRKKRTIPDALASKEDIENWEPKSSHNVHKTNLPGILCVDVHADQNQFVSGGVDKVVKVFNRGKGTVTASLTGHSKKVNTTLWLPQNDAILSTSADKTVRLWSKGGSGDYECSSVLSHHTGAVVGAAVQASGNYAVSASEDGSWAFLDLAAGQLLRHVKEEGAGVNSSVNFHPDGLILGVGTADGAIKIWDITSQTNVANCEGHTGAVNSVAFSENGYYMASGSQDGSVKLWDLRRLKNFKNLDMGGAVCSVHFDHSGSYLATGGQDIRVFGTKSWDAYTTLAAHTAEVTCVRFGANASFLASTSMDRALKFYA